jgi:hypothetical protein
MTADWEVVTAFTLLVITVAFVTAVVAGALILF